MKKQVMGCMTIGLLAMAMMVQGQPASRPGRNLNPGDSLERVNPMMRMNPMNGPGTGVMRPGQFEGRGSMGNLDTARGSERMRAFRGGAQSAPINRNMQRGGALSAPGNQRVQRGGIVPGLGLRNRQQGMQQGMRQGMQPGMRQGMRQGMRPGMAQGMGLGMRQGMGQGMRQGMRPGMRQGMRPGMGQGMRQGMQPSRIVDPEVRIKNEVDQLKNSLNLTSDQVKKITAIKEKQAKKQINAYKKAQKKEKSRLKKQQDVNKKIKSVLTDEQATRWKSNRTVVRPEVVERVGLGGNRFQRLQ